MEHRNLTDSQRELLGLLVETVEKMPAGAEPLVSINRMATGDFIYHPDLPRPGNEVGVVWTDVKELVDQGYLRIDRTKLAVTQRGIQMQERGQDSEGAAVDPRKVWVVHGRNERARKAMFQLLRAFDLQPIEWNAALASTGDASPYIGEVLNHGFKGAQAVVVLLTGDDVARLRDRYVTPETEAFESQLCPQPRPNVLFEAGMALATHPTATVLVAVGPLRPFTNIIGRHLVKMDGGVAARQTIATRLETAGCPVNRDGEDWHTVGDFEEPEDELHAVEEGATGQVGGEPDLDEEHVKILTLFVEESELTVEEVTGYLGIKEQRARLRLDQLINMEFLAPRYNIRYPTRYTLTHAGRAHLLEIGRL